MVIITGEHRAAGREPELADAVWGAAIGDALGVPFEFRGRGTITCTGMSGYGSYDQPAGTWSDDTSMLIATCDSIKECGGIDCDDMRHRFCQWAFEGRYTPDKHCFDIGGTTSTALVEGNGQSHMRSNGNGSLMRIAPLAFLPVSDKEIAEVSSITHAHEISCQACIVFVRVLQDVIAGTSLEEAIDRYFDLEEPFDRLGDLQRLDSFDIRSSGYVVHTLEAAFWCALHTDSFEECMIAAVELGEDTDTTACVAGALAGVLYGKKAIPSEWMKSLRARDVIERTLFE